MHAVLNTRDMSLASPINDISRLTNQKHPLSHNIGPATVAFQIKKKKTLSPFNLQSPLQSYISISQPLPYPIQPLIRFVPKSQ